tara:strand:+ start:1065 stop:3032 length:1968 start_codon:yes stop_codon:yes gene_type:complete
MAIYDLETGKPTNQQTVNPATNKPTQSPSGVRDLETGQLLSNAPQVDTDAVQKAMIAKQVADTGGLDSMMISAGKTVADVGRMFGFGNEETDIERQALADLREDRPITTALGQALPFVVPGVGVANIASLPTRVLAATTLGGAEGATIASGTDKDVFQGTGVGAAIGGGLELAFPVIGRIGSQLYRKLTGTQPRAPIVNSAGQPSEEFQTALRGANLSFDDVIKATSTGGIDDAPSLARQSFLEENGLIPTRAQVTGDAAQFQAQQELAKTSGRVRTILEGQESVLANRFENAISQTGGTANPSNSPVYDFIGDKALDLDSQISNAYKLARESAPTEKIVKPSSLTESIRDIAGSDSATGGLSSAARDILRSKGVLEQGRGLKAIGKVDAKTAEEIRIDLNGLYDSLTPFGRQKLSEMKDALDLDVEKAIGSDIFGPARQAKAKFEKDLSRAKVNKFDKRKKNLVRDVLENKVNPERFLEDAVLAKSVRATDLEQLKRYVLSDENPQGIEAWNDLRAEAMQRIANSAMPEVGGQKALSRAQMEKTLDRFGRDKLRVLFDKEEREFLTSMLKVSKIREPVRMTQQGLGPSGQAGVMVAKGLERVPLLADAFRGLARKMANNKALDIPEPVRNKLLRLTQPAVTGGAVVSTTQQQEQ